MWLGCPIHSIRAMDGNRLVVHVTDIAVSTSAI